MTHWLTLDDWDSDGINKSVRCDCNLGEDHHQADDVEDAAYTECRRCQAILDGLGLCWFCDQFTRIWTPGQDGEASSSSDRDGSTKP